MFSLSMMHFAGVSFLVFEDLVTSYALWQLINSQEASAHLQK